MKTDDYEAKNRLYYADLRYKRILAIAEEADVHKDKIELGCYRYEAEHSMALESFIHKYILKERPFSHRKFLEAEVVINRDNLRCPQEDIDKATHRFTFSFAVALLTSLPVVLTLLILSLFSGSQSLHFDAYDKWIVLLTSWAFILSWIYTLYSNRQIEKVELDNKAYDIIYSEYRIAQTFKQKEFYQHIKASVSGITDATRLAYYQHYVKWYEETLPNTPKAVHINYWLEFSDTEYQKLQEARNRNDDFCYTYSHECDFVKLLIMKGITSGNEKNA